MFNLPCTEQELKQQFRVLASKHHPDKGGSHEEFLAIRDEYERILVTRSFEARINHEANLEYKEKPSEHHVPCDVCHWASGYIKITETRTHQEYPWCNRCWGLGCRACDYTGKFTKHGKRTYKTEVIVGTQKCTKCEGTGWVRWGNPVINLDHLVTKRPHSRERNKK